MSLTDLLSAPEGLAMPVAYLYSAIAQAVDTAIAMHSEHRPPAHSGSEFRSLAHGVAAAMDDADRTMAQTEVFLGDKAPERLKTCCSDGEDFW
jgi:hypothetical protein